MPIRELAPGRVGPSRARGLPQHAAKRRVGSRIAPVDMVWPAQRPRLDSLVDAVQSDSVVANVRRSVSYFVLKIVLQDL